MINKNTHLVFKPNYGFAVYNSDHGTISWTQVVQEATEATKDDWSDIIGSDIVECEFVPANSYVHRLEQERDHLEKLSNESKYCLRQLLYSRSRLGTKLIDELDDWSMNDMEQRIVSAAELNLK